MDDVLGEQATVGHSQDPVLALLGNGIQSRFRDELTELGWAREAEMEAETLASLAILGAFPRRLQSGLLVIIQAQDPVRSELKAHNLVNTVDGEGLDWALTDFGEKIAAVLAGLVPPSDADWVRDEDDPALRRRIALAHATGEERDRS